MGWGEKAIEIRSVETGHLDGVFMHKRAQRLKFLCERNDKVGAPCPLERAGACIGLASKTLGSYRGGDHCGVFLKGALGEHTRSHSLPFPFPRPVSDNSQILSP